MSETPVVRTWEIVNRWADRQPDREALVFEADRWTWREVAGQVDRYAGALLALGVQRGDRVALLAMARNEFLPLFLAANKIGAMFLGLSPKFTESELAFLLADAEPRVLITLRDYAGRDVVGKAAAAARQAPAVRRVLVLGEAAGGARSFRDALEHGVESDEVAARAAESTPDDPALLIYTSGSTGHPKGAVHTHRGIVASAALEVEQFGFSPDTRILLHFPINHVAAAVEIGYAALYAGGAVIHLDHFDPRATLRCIEAERINTLGQVPAMFLMQMATREFAETDLSHVRTFVWSGTPAPGMMVDSLLDVAEKTGARLQTGYGSTELCGFATYSEPDIDDETLLLAAGRPVPPVEVRIVDERRRPLPSGDVGEMAVRGPMVMQGYYKQPELTDKVLDADGWYYTGDMARSDDRGYVTIVGRKTDMFKTAGENVYPAEVEEVLLRHPAVALAAVLGVPDPVYQEVGRAFIVPKQDAQVDKNGLRTHCKAVLAKFKVPRYFEIRDTLPLLPTGKVDKAVLRRESGLS